MQYAIDLIVKYFYWWIPVLLLAWTPDFYNFSDFFTHWFIFICFWIKYLRRTYCVQSLILGISTCNLPCPTSPHKIFYWIWFCSGIHMGHVNVTFPGTSCLSLLYFSTPLSQSWGQPQLQDKTLLIFFLTDCGGENQGWPLLVTSFGSHALLWCPRSEFGWDLWLDSDQSNIAKVMLVHFWDYIK